MTFDIIKSIQEHTYYCSKCKREHYYWNVFNTRYNLTDKLEPSKIYQKHLKFKGEAPPYISTYVGDPNIDDGDIEL